jgi:hypothetical protein
VLADDAFVEDEKEPIDIVVVDRDFNDLLGDARHDSPDRGGHTPETHHFLDFHHLHHLDNKPGTRPNTGHSSRSGVHSHNQTKTETTSASGNPRTRSSLRDNPVWICVRWRFLARVFYFFHSPFPDPEKERAYMKETCVKSFELRESI